MMLVIPHRLFKILFAAMRLIKI